MASDGKTIRFGEAGLALGAKDKVMPVGVTCQLMDDGAKPGDKLTAPPPSALAAMLAAKGAQGAWAQLTQEVASKCGGGEIRGWRGHEETIAEVVGAHHATFQQSGLEVYFCKVLGLGGVVDIMSGGSDTSKTAIPFWWLELVDTATACDYVPAQKYTPAARGSIVVTKEKGQKIGVTPKVLTDLRVVCTGCAEGSLAYEVGLRSGDVIKSINGKTPQECVPGGTTGQMQGALATFLVNSEGEVRLEVEHGAAVNAAKQFEAFAAQHGDKYANIVENGSGGVTDGCCVLL